MTIAAAGSSPLPPTTSTDIVGALNQVVSALTQLVQLLQQRATAGTTGGGAPAGVAQLDPTQGSAGDPKQAAAAAAAPGGCGCCGASDAFAGAAGAPTQLADQSAPTTPPAPAADAKPPAAPASGDGITAKPGTREYNAQVVAKVAREMGVDPVVAVADAIHESNLNAKENSGDGGSSFGLFQLHEGGELPKDWYPGAANHAKAFDPEANARVALKEFAALKDKYSGGELAYHAERPADHAGYVKAVEANFDEARKLLAS